MSIALSVAKSLRRFRYGEAVIVVSGLPRSGTSMAMQMLAGGGVPVVTDGIRKENEDNPKGYYEDERVKDLHLDEQDGSFLRESRGKAVKIISFLLKNLPETNNYKVLFMNRALPEVLASQLKMLERRGEPNETSDEKMLDLWRDHLWRAKYLLKHAAQFEVLEMEYRAVVDSPLEQARRMRDFLGLPLDVEAMAAAVDKKLYRNRA
jgi:hypothetical protein